MKKYYQVTEVSSEKMTFDKALELGYTTDYTSPNKHGYHVEYDDGTNAWIPKELFEATYKPKDK